MHIMPLMAMCMNNIYMCICTHIHITDKYIQEYQFLLLCLIVKDLKVHLKLGSTNRPI